MSSACDMIWRSGPVEDGSLAPVATSKNPSLATGFLASNPEFNMSKLISRMFPDPICPVDKNVSLVPIEDDTVPKALESG